MNASATLRAGTEGLEAQKNDRETRQCPTLSISALLLPGVANQLAIARISLPRKNFDASPRNLK
jgi:hypothetical protein